MKQAVRTMIAAGFLVTGLMACKSKVQETPQQPVAQPQAAAPASVTEAASNEFVGKVIETMDAGGYTYVHVDNGTKQLWAAAPQFATKVGETVTVPEGMPMMDYESKTLNRKFDEVLFVGAIGTAGQTPAAELAPAGDATLAGQPQMPEGAHPKLDPAQAAKDAKVSFVGIKKADKTVGDIYAAQASLGGKQVAVRGKVVKFSAQIMGKNWLHVQDGTGQTGTNDLTVTTGDTAKVGDTVLVTGKITLNKDFGMGYKYDLIIEDGQVKVE